MSNRELDARAAEVVMGYTVVRNGEWCYFDIPREDGDGTERWFINAPGEHWGTACRQSWNPSTDIVAACMLIDRLCPPPGKLTDDKPLGRSFSSTFGGLNRSNCSGRYTAYFSGSIHKGDGVFEIHKCGQAEADTREMAITLAAIEAAERKKK